MKTFAKILFGAVIVLTVAKAFDGPPPPPCNPKVDICPAPSTPRIPK